MDVGCCITTKHVALAKAFGYDFVELAAKELMLLDHHAWDSVKQEILNIDIPVIGLNAFCDETHPLVGPNVNLDQLSQYLDILLSRAKDLHCRNIGIGAPLARQLPKDFSYELATTQMKDFLTLASQKAATYDIKILYEAINPKECNFGTGTQEIYDLIQYIHLPNLKIVWDIFHSVNAKESYPDVISMFDSIEHVHICSWDKYLHRFYLLEKDQPYVNEAIAFLSNQNYTKTVSIEANDESFEKDGPTSLRMIRVAMNR